MKPIRVTHAGFTKRAMVTEAETARKPSAAIGTPARGEIQIFSGWSAIDGMGIIKMAISRDFTVTCVRTVSTRFVSHFWSMAMHALPRFVVFCLSISLLAGPASAAKQSIKKLNLDPGAPTVDLFDAVAEGTIETTVIAKNSNEATLFVTNNSSAPLSIKIPQAVVAIQVLKQQFFQQGARNGNQGPGMPGGNMTGQAQPIGGGQQNGNGNPNGAPNNGPGMNNGPTVGFFSVPPHKTVQVPLKTVCLSHGKPDPRPRMKYQLVKLEDYTSDPALQETLKLVATGDTDLESVQAAVWHLSDKMSWKDLRAKQIERLGGLDPQPYFTEKQLDEAENMSKRVREKVKDVPRRTETAAK